MGRKAPRCSGTVCRSAGVVGVVLVQQASHSVWRWLEPVGMSDALCLSVALSVALCCLCHANWTLLAAHQGCGQPRLSHCGTPPGLSCVGQQRGVHVFL